MVNPLDSYKDGYRVFVRTVSGLTIFICTVSAAFLYFFRVAISQTYFPESSNARDLSMIGLTMGIAFYFALSIWRGKFFWFIGGAKRDT